MYKRQDIIPALGADETVIDFEVTSNRADCFSILGLAREAAVTMNGHFRKPEVKVKEECAARAEDVLDVEVRAPEPVSYTHLDVYKRQPEEESVLEFFRLLCLFAEKPWLAAVK